MTEPAQSAESDPRAWIAALRQSHERLMAAVTELGDDDLRHATMSTAWTVTDLLSHIGSGAEIGLATLQASVADREVPGGDANHVVWDRWNDKTPGEIVTGVGPADAALVEAFEALTPEQLADLRVSMPFLPDPIDVAETVGFRLSEHALHTWDLVAAFAPDAELAPDATRLLIDRLAMMVGFVGRFTPRETRPAATVTLAVSTTDPRRRFELEVGDVLDLRPVGPEEDDTASSSTITGRLTIPAEAFLRLAAGRLGPGTASGDLEPSGAATMATLRRAFPGY